MHNIISHDYEIAIIGGGLAGLTLAIQAADKGYEVILFEKESYPFHKVCGEYISMESRDFLLRCGIPLDTMELPVIDTLQVSDAKGKGYEFALPLGGFGISRFLLDDTLYRVALQKGVTILADTKVNDVQFTNDSFSIQAGGKIYTSQIAAGCFGKRSNLDLKWGRKFATAKPNKLNNLIAVKYHIRYPHDIKTISLHNFHNGYCGISRIENGASCLCYLTTAENLKRSGNSISRMEKEILSKNQQLAAVFTRAEQLYLQPITISQVSFEQKAQVEEHILMLGDAAGLITPLCGNGMSMAMHASLLAFQSIDSYLSGKITREEMENRYQSEWKEQFSARMRMGRMVQYFFGGQTTTSLFLRLMHTLPGLSGMLIRQTHGKPF